MKKLRKAREKSCIVALCLCYLAVISAVVLTAVMLMNAALKRNVKQRTFQELNSKARIHMSLIESDIERHFAKLHVIDSFLDFEHEIYADEYKPMWQVIEQMGEFSTIGFADLSGNAVDYHGEVLGNISDRSYFTDIVDDHAAEQCVYLETTLYSEEPKILFAIPIYREGKMLGVLFESKEISKLDGSLVEDTQFDGQAGMVVTDAEGNIVLASDNASRNLSFDNLLEDKNVVFKGITGDELKRALQEERSGKCEIKYKNTNQYVVYTPSGVNDWTLFCMVDKDSAAAKCGKNQVVIRQTTLVITAMFGLSLILSALLIILYIKKKNYTARECQIQYNGYKKIMDELTCPVFEYDVRNDRITGNQPFCTSYGLDHINDFTTMCEAWKDTHPEFNFDGLMTEINDSIQNRKIVSFETVLKLSGKKPCWIKNVLVPVSDDTQEVVSVFNAMIDTTKEHIRFENAMEMMMWAPSGLHRCYLSDPIHVEYIGEGLHRMLGYTKEELDALLGSERQYTNLLSESDKKIFEDYVRRLSMTGGIDTCEYSMVCKDGSLLAVSDTMEVKCGSDGIEYGYAVVTDISKYQEAQKTSQKELEDLKIQLNESRLKVSTGQMQPHFLYNALASIREVVLDDPQYGADLIYDFTTHLRACIKSMSSDEYIPFEQEIANVKAYVNIEKMRFGDKLQVKYNILESDFSIIPLSIQPLVENAIRHGIYERGDRGGLVEVSTYRDGDSVVIKVQDDGVGFDVAAIKKEVEEQQRDSTGLYNLVFRFEKIMDAEVRVESCIGEGAKITVRIPTKGEKKR